MTSTKLDKRFEVRTVGDSAVIVRKGEVWDASPATETSGASAGPLGEMVAGMGRAVVAFAAGGAGAAAGGGGGGGGAAGGGGGGGGAAAAPAKAYVASTLPLEERFRLVRSIGEECIEETELRNLLEKKPFPVAYDGFEPSGRMHIAQGILKAINVNKLTSAGCVFKFWVADWFALLNNKMGGDLKKIRTVGRYMIEVWKAAGMDMRNVEFLWASDEINRDPDAYWMRVIDVARRNTVTRVQRCCTIMGRKEGEELSAAQIMYPCMQCADIFFLKADICQLGMDQRKVNMLAREYCDSIKQKLKPVILSHHMMMGLKEGQEKMSKSDPDSAIFMEDSVEDVNRKIRTAFCPPGVAEGNPCLDWMKHIVFGRFDSVEVKRNPENGGDKAYTDYAEMEADFVSGALHPGDLKECLKRYINACLDPVRRHFASGEPAALLKLVRSYSVTR